ncbi:Chromatin structure-remodeling complex subunit rsc7 [Candida viswanathii]|uniref:Chromatin structure-remodeling complex subunit rsc7 n=1 Tax=Candida viswanathii TaxID=5486 RepID=A0A367XRN0_9ASCO|nr:Chromatin structure-remodeling complex subunit rsc7 [Candida viswanathii]
MSDTKDENADIPIEEPQGEKDGEYKGDEIEEDDYEEEEEEAVNVGPKKGRKRKAVNEDDEDEPEEEEEEELKHESEEEEESGEEGPVEGETEGEPVQGGKKKRGRKKKQKVQLYGDDVFDEEGNPKLIENDEVVIPLEDPKGKEKIDELGYLNGDRKFRMKTFKLLGHGDRLYMISTEPARLVGFRDSYLLFKTHRTLFKKVADNDEKMDLIQRGIIPNSYKGRAVNLVTARSIFREFGSRMIENGKKVIDDFWEQRAIDNGDTPGELADPDQLYKNKLSNVLGDVNGLSSTGHATPLTATTIVNYQTDPTWLYQIAKQTAEYNSKLYEVRSKTANKGYKDVYANLTYYPRSTQPTKSSVQKVTETKNDNLVYDIVIQNPNIRRPTTGLASVSRDVVDLVDDPEIKQAILEQQDYERSVNLV